MSRYRNDEPKIKLEYYSERFARKLFKRFPDWKQYAGHFADGKPDDFAFYLDVRVPSANPSVSDPLRIMTFQEDATVAWIGGIHHHFRSWWKRNDTSYMEEAIEFIEALITDQVVFGYYVQDGKPTGNGFYYGIAANLPPGVPSTKHGSVIMRSWLGGHDKELHP